MRKLLSNLGDRLAIISLYVGAAFIFIVMGFGFSGQILLGFAIGFSLAAGWLALLMIAIAIEHQLELIDRKKRNRRNRL